MHPSSLIFVLIVAVWAAYLLQHWIRRREALVTARSVDQFSEAMRVLEHRGTAPAHDDTVAVKKSSTTTPAQVSTPLPRTSLRAGSVMTSDTPTEQTRTPIDEPVHELDAVSAPVRVGSHVIRALAALNSRRVRGIALLASLALLAFAVVLAPFGMLPWWSPVVSLVLVGGVFAWLRKEAVAEQSARGEDREATVSTTRPVQRPAVHSGPQLGGAQRVAMPSRDLVFDNAQPAPSATAKPTPQAEQVEGSWSPVPVPRPTYTMKAKAEPTAPSLPESSQSTAARHADTPIDELPFDGLALDEDLEELPSVFRAG
ncbi:hypothetical protein [Leekyejoonella antrihumi]|uniref:Uncharacterized protein n=1 Tax=Leekyejoonella antrihumi TaxID=1660198 RepID=A0A563E8J9_9MICO|nr:hypothetical protein [Leekyejoonella antrihumi]TWP38639.1 hypothetical protein FGL98_02310 [Leekyejoonella antrihumi]